MKKQIIIGSLFAITSVASAQWAPTIPGGNSQMYNNAAVGIGLPTSASIPAMKLEVRTNNSDEGIQITQAGLPGSHGAAALFLTHDNNNMGKWALMATGPDSPSGLGNFAIYDALTDKFRFYIMGGNGNIGIGTDNPQNAVDITTGITNGGITITQTTSGESALTLINKTSGPVDAKYVIGATGAANAQGPGHFSIYDYNNAIDRFFIQENTGFVGLGNADPSQALDVSGNISIQGGHSVFNSQNGMIDWGSSGIGDLYFRTLNTQGSIGAYSDKMIIKNDGKIGIGTLAPSKKLSVEGDAILISNNGFNGIEFLGNNQIPTRRGITTDNDPNGNFNFYINSNQLPSAFNFKNGLTNTNLMRIDAYGKVFIGNQTNATSNAYLSINGGGANAIEVFGSTNNREFLLTNAGSLYAREIRVKVGSIPDYVFEPDYKLLSLREVEEYYKKYKHLPEVASEKEILANNLNVGEMSAILLKKVEELTLYLVDQNKQLEAAKKEIENLKQQVKK